MFQFTKHFTPDEASATLPLVKKIVADILREGQILQQMKDDAKDELDEPTEVRKQLTVVGSLFTELKDLGCFYKGYDFETGLVDFPAVIDGEEVLLCWKSDEASLEWYHGIEDGFAGRRRIPQLQTTES